ncbi:MAG: Smr/MutS family protein [Gammaproteobacteria bacterium]|nr:Smr/MutS family protein [Gammaproteobacteria bacterium]MDH3446692.1 Smr/MutS family protein [Gammaproteobacteria bacterium]
MNDEDDSEFARLIPGVKRLQTDRINLFRQRNRKKPARMAPQQDTAIEDDATFRATPQRDAYFNSGLQKKLQRRIRQGLIRPEASLDLHGCRQQEALQMLQHFFANALQQRQRMIVIIHGQGYRSQNDAILKPLVQRWLTGRPEVLAWCPAQPRDGAAGASYVYLRSS